MTPTEQRLAAIYSYYLDERYSDDFGGTFAEWLSQSMYGDELVSLCADLFTVAFEVARNETNTQGQG